MALVAFIALPLAIRPVVRIGRRMRRVSANTQVEQGQLTTLLNQTFQGARHVKAYGMEEYEQRRAAALFERIYRLIDRATRTRARAGPMIEALGGAAIALVIFYGGHQVIVGASTPGAFFSFITALLLAYQPAKSLANLNASLQEGLAAAQRVFEVLDLEPAIRDAPDARPLRVQRGRSALRGGALRLSARHGRARRDFADRSGRQHGRAGRSFRRREIDASQSDPALLRRRCRPHPDRRSGNRHGYARLAARRGRAGLAGGQPVRRHGARQYRVWPVRRARTPISRPPRLPPPPTPLSANCRKATIRRSASTGSGSREGSGNASRSRGRC